MKLTSANTDDLKAHALSEQMRDEAMMEEAVASAEWWEEDFDEKFPKLEQNVVSVSRSSTRGYIDHKNNVKSFISRLLVQQKERILAALPKADDLEPSDHPAFCDGFRAALSEVRKVIKEA